MKKIISTPKAPAAIGPYSQAIEVNGLLFTSGVIPIVPSTGELVEGDIEAQAEQAIGNLAALIEAAGAKIENTIKTTVFIKNMDDFTKVNEIYASVITAGTHLAPSIKVAEAAKVIENSQRDINIAFVNELSKIFNKMGIDTQEVLEAASTKWNFLPFKPGLVGGHCIGVDPYYLAQCAQRHGYNPEIILAGRRMNDGMGEYVANEVIKLMLKKGIQVLSSNILILGFTFKENCPDVRNTKVIDIYKALKSYNLNISVYDPWANPEIAKREYGIEITNELPESKFDALIFAVAHDKLKELEIDKLLNQRHVLYDVKGCLQKEIIDGRL